MATAISTGLNRRLASRLNTPKVIGAEDILRPYPDHLLWLRPEGVCLTRSSCVCKKAQAERSDDAQIQLHGIAPKPSIQSLKRRNVHPSPPTSRAWRRSTSSRPSK